ncbi:MAG: 2-keto-4-pentenoate hydratase [Granulosicoccus sp.]
MNTTQQAAEIILDNWNNGGVLSELPENIAPTTPEGGYAVQAELARLRGEPVVGWKIAATSEKGRNHIRVDRPMAGRLYPSIVYKDGSTIALASNRMLVAEAEIVLTLKQDLPPLERQRSEEEVAAAVGKIHAGLEFPDSRFDDFTVAGTACLIADNACARHFVLGEAVTPPADLAQLAQIPTMLRINNKLATSGLGSDALGGSLTALTWLVNTVNELGISVNAGEFVTTGVTGAPTPIHPNDHLEVLIGTVASVAATVVA